MVDTINLNDIYEKAIADGGVTDDNPVSRLMDQAIRQVVQDIRDHAPNPINDVEAYSLDIFIRQHCKNEIGGAAATIQLMQQHGFIGDMPVFQVKRIFVEIVKDRLAEINVQRAAGTWKGGSIC